MERLTYDFCIGGNHCWQVKGADNLECREVCERQGDDGCKTCPISKAFDRLAAIEDILGEEYELDDLKTAMWCKETVGMAFSEDTAPVERLRELWFADKDGRCVVLPCKIFDKIWNVAAHYQFEVTEIDLLPYGNILFRCGNKGTDDYAAFYGDDLGDTFTFEEPQERDNCVVKEAALRREQDG